MKNSLIIIIISLFSFAYYLLILTVLIGFMIFKYININPMQKSNWLKIITMKWKFKQWNENYKKSLNSFLKYRYKITDN